MSYFDEVYLKRMNKAGTNNQQRVLSRKETEFDELFLRNTKYLGNIHQCGDRKLNINCSVQPNKWNQDKKNSKILCSLSSCKFATGDILKIKQEQKEEVYDRNWLITFVSEDISHGYQLYHAICLEDEIVIKDEYGETLHTVPVKIVSETTVFVQDKISSYGSVSYREPLAHRKMFTRDYDFLKKETYFEYKGKGWEISGIDNLSINGVAVCSITEQLIREPEPITSQDIEVGENDNFFLIGR